MVALPIFKVLLSWVVVSGEGHQLAFRETAPERLHDDLELLCRAVVEEGLHLIVGDE